ncbi:MAG: EF-P lysine aminoacylase EpmA [Alphaproteobacteria bacterium]|nr:EF-P lysine aminoacylase EpmA [Alphaproteobacteria bacterium]
MNKPMTAPWWRPDQFARRRPFLETRGRVLRAARSYFEDQGFTEVETPALQISPGNETHLHAFATLYTDLMNGEKQTYYLHTSPEFAMKKLLVAGLPKIFQIAHVFRNGERSSRHHPEFSMLEWYRAGGRLSDIKQDCIDLVRATAKVAGRTVFAAQGMTCDPFAEWESIGVPEAFRRYAGIDLMATGTDAALLAPQVAKAGLRLSPGDTWEDLFFRVMGEKIEPFLGKDRPAFLCDYPVGMAALARPKRDDPRLAERFELYICGYELANAFDELTDAAEQKKRFEADMAAKERLYGERYPIDADFIAALEHGMPESAGIALGFDRLAMLCAGTEEISEVLWAPVSG